MIILKGLHATSSIFHFRIKNQTLFSNAIKTKYQDHETLEKPHQYGK